MARTLGAASVQPHHRGRIYQPRAEDFTKQIEEVHTELKKNLGKAQERYKQSYDRHAIAAPNFNPRDKVWLNRRQIRTTRPLQKLDVKRMGHFRMVAKVGGSGVSIPVGPAYADASAPCVSCVIVGTVYREWDKGEETGAASAGGSGRGVGIRGE